MTYILIHLFNIGRSGVENTSKDQNFPLVSSEGVVLTKDNLAKKNWKGSQQCVCCNSNETILHLFLDCPSAK
jgi:hypothetical protein